MNKRGMGPGPTGLGRNLAGILDDAMQEFRAPEVAGLLGKAPLRRAPEVRRLVSEVALDAISDSFDTLGVILVRGDEEQARSIVGSRVPASWSLADPLGFEVVGRLWSLMEHGPDPAATQGELDLGSVQAFITRQATGDSRVAAAVLRATRFSPHEQRIIERLLLSVSAAFGSSSPLAPDTALEVTLDSVDGVHEASVRARRGTESAEATARSSGSRRAVADAAVALCPRALDVAFVGSTTVEGGLVSIVVINEPDGGPLFGLAITDPADPSGPAEAALAAAAVVGADPFAADRQGDDDRRS